MCGFILEIKLICFHTYTAVVCANIPCDPAACNLLFLTKLVFEFASTLHVPFGSYTKLVRQHVCVW